MENASMTFNHRQRVTAWIREHVPSAHPSRVSHTRVKVLSRTKSIVPKGPMPARSLFDRPLDGKWTEGGPELRSHSENRHCVKRNTTSTADKNVNITSHTQRGKDDDEETTPSSCLCLPVRMPTRIWRRRRQAKVVPVSSQIPSDIIIKKMRVDEEEATQVIPITPDITPFCMGDGPTQKNPTPEVATNTTLFGVVTTEIDTPGQESQTVLKDVPNDMETKGQELPTKVAKTVMDPPLHKHQSILKVVPALQVDYSQQEKTAEMSSVEDHISFDLPKESIDSLRPKTSRGFKQDLGQEFPTERIRGNDSMVNVWVREEDKQKHIQSGDQNLAVSELEIKKTCDVLSFASNIDESDGENTDGTASELADLQSSNDDENDSWEQIEEAVAASRMSSRINVENQREEVRELSQGGERGNNEASEEEIQYELNQREHWQLAAIGEWSVICQDDEEVNDDIYSFLMKDEFQKEQEIREDWKPILDRYQSLSIIQDLRTMQTLSKCTINQSERAMRQFARICRGPVPLSHSGQTKTEAISSLSRKLHQQTNRISEEISNTFMEFYHIFEEMDALRERQDRVEDFFQKDLEKRKSEKSRASAFPPRSATPRRSSSRLHQWELDIDLMDVYSEGKVKSSSLVTVMPTIEENKIYSVQERRGCSQLSHQSNECRESDYDSDDFPEYKGMDYVSPGESDVTTTVDDTDNRDDDVTFTGTTGENSVKRDEDSEDEKAGLKEKHAVFSNM